MYGICYSDSRWQQGEETRLRGHISKLKGERSKVRATTQLGLESIHSDPPPPSRSRNPSSCSEARKLDLETAVLMQVNICIPIYYGVFSWFLQRVIYQATKEIKHTL
jgi:hypothetical protein